MFGEKAGKETQMKEIAMEQNDQLAFKQAVEYASDWCKKHQWEIGAAEMALGASVIALGVQSGAIEIGKDIVGSALHNFNIGDKLGGAIGGGTGAVAGAIIGSIGVVPFGGIAIPAAVMIGGGALVLGSLGYTAGDLIYNFLNPASDLGQFFAGASLLVVGAALLVDGARRIIKDKRVLAAVSRIKDGVLCLVDLAVKVVAKSMSELKTLMQKLFSKPNSTVDAAGSVMTAAAAAGGAAIGGSIAAGSVTVLGSHALGAAALSLGLVSAPLWPVIASGAAGLGIGYAAWKSVKFLGIRIKK